MSVQIISSGWGIAGWGIAPWGGALSATPTPTGTFSAGIELHAGFVGSGGAQEISEGIELHAGFAGVQAFNWTAGEILGAAFGGRTEPVGPASGVNLGADFAAVSARTASWTAGIELHLSITDAFGSFSAGSELHAGFVPSLHAAKSWSARTTLGASFIVSISLPSTFTLSVTVLTGGSDYTSPPTVTFSNGATGTAVLGSGSTAGQVVGVTVTDTGSSLPPGGTVTAAISGGGGAGATVSVNVVNTTSATAAQQQQPFQVRAEGYGALTIESLIVPRGTNPASALQLLQPPLRQPTQDAGQSSQQAQAGQTQSTTFSKPWARWLVDLYQYLSGQSPASASTLTFECPSIDETDSEWYATGKIDGSTDPITVTVTFVNQSRFGIQYTVLAGGTGYTAPIATVSGANGTGWYATNNVIVQGGAIVAIEGIDNGYGYDFPLSVQITDSTGTGALAIAALGRQFNVGDYLLWNDPAINGGAYSYEIDQLTAIVPVSSTQAKFTFTRATAGGSAGQAQFGSPLQPHGQVTPCGLYRLIDKVFSANPNNSAGTPQLLKFLWDNMTVCAVLASSSSFANSVLLSQMPSPYLPGTTTLDLTKQPPQPGLRTMNGAAYTTLGVTGPLAVGATSAARVSVQAHESIRTVYAKVQVPPIGATGFNGDPNACIVIYVCYIAPPMISGSNVRVVGLIDTIVIDQSAFTSYLDDNAVSPLIPNVPDGRMMPYHDYWPANGIPLATATGPNVDWPPNRLPVCTAALDSNGNLQLPITVDDTQTVLFAPDGQIDFIIAQVGSSTAGSTLIVTVQT